MKTSAFLAYAGFGTPSDELITTIEMALTQALRTPVNADVVHQISVMPAQDPTAQKLDTKAFSLGILAVRKEADANLVAVWSRWFARQFPHPNFQIVFIKTNHEEDFCSPFRDDVEKIDIES